MARGSSRPIAFPAWGALDRRKALALGVGVIASAAPGGRVFAAKAKQVRVSAIYTLEVADPWISRIHKALKAAEARGDITYVFSQNVGGTDYESVIRHRAQEGADLVVGDAFAVERPARKVAADYPTTAFLMGSALGPTRPNLAMFDSLIEEPCYLAGMVAGRTTRANVIGLVGGHATRRENRLMQAFMAGAGTVNPQVKFTIAFAGSRDERDKVQEAATAAVERGADVLYAGRAGVADVAKARGVKAIGTLVDAAAQYPGTIIASALWHAEPTIDAGLRHIAEGRFTAADHGAYSAMIEGGASLAALDPKLVPPEVVAEVQAREKEIRDGLFRVTLNETEPKPTL